MLVGSASVEELVKSPSSMQRELIDRRHVKSGEKALGFRLVYCGAMTSTDQTNTYMQQVHVTLLSFANLHTSWIDALLGLHQVHQGSDCTLSCTRTSQPEAYAWNACLLVCFVVKQTPAESALPQVCDCCWS